MRRRAGPSVQDDEADDDLPVMVPLNSRALMPMDPERVRRLRKHLVQSLRAMRTMKRPAEGTSPVRPELEGFVGEVARAACALCRADCAVARAASCGLGLLAPGA